ncbi:MAG: tRNA pseudouridine55 synthase [Parcubacteria group bacterium Gr01-1014_46]|nr:MAG: tRNA pseudouridine55 synthase [Parcubacteria group bacterium Gr01-1014_46]
MEASQEKDVYVVYKNLGETPLECIQRFKKNKPEFGSSSVTYAGRLDPMAEGLLILLTNEKVNEKEKYLDLPKTYEFEVLWGFETDTLDILGKISNSKFQISKQEEVEDYLKKTVGKFEQKYPDYSSKPVQGKPLFQWAREDRLSEIDIPKHEVEVFEAKYISRRIISKEDLLNDIDFKIGKVRGDFRQKEILEKWKEVLSGTSEENFVIDKLELKVSSGFYVRQFVSDMAEDLGMLATTFHIKRTKIGDCEI